VVNIKRSLAANRRARSSASAALARNRSHRSAKLRAQTTSMSNDMTNELERKSRIPTAADVLAQQKADHAGTGTAVAPTGLDPYAVYGAAATRRQGELLKFSRGDYLAGANNELAPIGTKMVANMEEAVIGWQRWEANKPTEQRMGRIADGFVPPTRRDLGDLDEELWERDDEGKPRNPWQYTSQVPMCRLEDGKQFTFTTSSDGGNKAVGALCVDYSKRRANHPDHHPIVTLGWSDYPHPIKSRGRIKFPVFQIVGWTPINEGTSEGNGSAGNTDQDEVPFD
jgi:hypothetical protein